MKKKNLNRRNFIKTTGLPGGIMLLANAYIPRVAGKSDLVELVDDDLGTFRIVRDPDARITDTTPRTWELEWITGQTLAVPLQVTAYTPN